MKKSAKFFGKSLLALALGVIAVAGLAVAGLLSYYGKVVGTVTVSQSVILRAYDSNGNKLGESTPTSNGNPADLTCTGSVTAGDTLTNCQISSSNVAYFALENTAQTATATVSLSGLIDPSDISTGVKFVTYDESNKSCTDNEITGSQTINAGGNLKFCIRVPTKVNAQPTTATITVFANTQ
jgi:hypothetical protein